MYRLSKKPTGFFSVGSSGGRTARGASVEGASVAKAMDIMTSIALGLFRGLCFLIHWEAELAAFGVELGSGNVERLLMAELLFRILDDNGEPA